MADPEGSRPEEKNWATESFVGKNFAGCDIKERISQGAMGNTFRGHDQLLLKDASITIIHPRLLRIEGFRDRLRQEIECAMALGEEGNVGVLRYEFLQPYLIVISPFIQGVSIREVLRLHGRLDLPRALWVAHETLALLDDAHRKQLIHKDIKPENLRVCQVPKLSIVGWGMLRVINATTSESISSYGSLFGTPEYMAPDQITHGQPEAASDLYSVGISLYEMITGQPPFQGNRIVEILKKQLVEKVPSVKLLRPDVPDSVDELIQSLTAKDPKKRPDSAATAADQLRMLMADQGIQPIQPFNLPNYSVQRRATERISPVSMSALQNLAASMENSLNFGMLAFESDEEDGYADYGGFAVQGQAGFAPANSTQEIIANALEDNLHASLQSAVEQGKATKAVPEILEQLFTNNRHDEILTLEAYLKSVLPTMAEVPFYVGLSFEKNSAFDDACAQFEQTLALNPHHLQAALHLARCLTEGGHLDKAEAVLYQAMQTSSSSDLAAAKYAEFMYIVRRNGKAAIPAYQKAIRLAPSRLHLRKQLAWILVEEGFFESAEAVLRELSEWAGNNELAKPIFEELQRRRAEQKKARESSTSILMPGEHPAESALLAVQWPEDLATDHVVGPSRWLEIREEYQNIPIPPPVEKKTGKKKTRKGRIKQALAVNDYQKAADLARMGLAEDPKNVYYLLALGRADFELGQYDEAVKVYRFVTKIDPSNDEAKTGLSAAKMARKLRST